MDRTNKFTTAGELLRLRGVILMACIRQDLTFAELYRAEERETDVSPPLHLGRFGLSRNRAVKLLSLHWMFWEVAGRGGGGVRVCRRWSDERYGALVRVARRSSRRNIGLGGGV